MLRSKKDVDKHVQDLLKKVINETERKLLGFNFAKLYHQIGEQKLARQHLASYLAVKETSAPGHRLAGQIAEALGDKDAAVKSYRRSYDLESTQKDLVFKICSLLCELPANPANRDLQRCWLERAEALQPKHSVVFELKERLMLSSDSQAKGELEDQLKNEMLTKPADMKLRIHLLKIYLDAGKVKEAYDHMVKIESLQVFSQELDWYSCVLSVLEAFSIQSSGQKLGADFYSQLLNAVERAAFLKIARVGQGHKTNQNISEAAVAVHRLDTSLQQAATSGLARDILVHFTCQLYFLTGLVVLLKAQAGQEDENQALSYAASLFAVTYNQEAISAHSRSADKKLLDAWTASATYRLSQCGHCVVAWEGKEGRKWVVDTVKKWDNADGRRRIFESVYSSAGNRPYYAESFVFPKGQLELPCFADLLELDKKAAQLNCSDLHPMVWLGLRYYTMHRRSDEMDFAPDLSQILIACRFVYDIPFSVSSWNSSAPETLSALDIEAFIYATIYGIVSMDESSMESKGIRTVPAALTRSTCTEQQSAWWQAAVKLVTGSAKESLGELRRTLQRGLEVIRLSGNNHGVPLELVAKLARTFMTRAGKARTFPAVDVPAPISTDVLSVEQTEALEAQAGRYWKVFLDMANSGNRFTPPLSGRLFEYRPADVDIDALIQEAKLYTGYQMWRSGRREEAQRLLQSIVDPFASYYQGLLFKELAEEELRKGATVYESRSAANVLLNKSRDAFYVTLDRLRSPGMERFHPLDQKLAEVIEKVETKLGSLTNLSVANGHTTEEEDESEEREFTTPQQTTSTPHRRSLMPFSSMRNGGGGTPIASRLGDASARVESRPSPERLDAQLRQMVHRQEEFNQAISNELKHIRSEVVDIKTLIQKLETHLEMQAKEEYRGRSKKSDRDRASEAYEEDEGDWEEDEEDVGEDEVEEEELNSLIRLKGKLKGSGRGAGGGAAGGLPPVNLPLYAPPFAPPTTRPPTYGFPQPYGAPFPYGQYPGFPHAGYMGVPSPVAPFPVTPGYGAGYPAGMTPHWDAMAQPGTIPGGPSFLPGGVPAVVQPGQIPTQQQPTVPAAAPAPAPAPSSVFSRLGAKDQAGANPLLSTSLQQQPPQPQQQPTVVSHVSPMNSSDSALEALRRAAANSQTAPHGFQISLPAGSSSPEKALTTTSTTSTTTPLSTRGLLANIPEPQYSSVTPVASSPEKGQKPGSGRDRKASSCSEGSYVEEEVDNYPDFKPIIPLPEEVEVKTGEEGQDVLFDQRAKLFRFVDGEWKERGVGQLKLLQDPATKKVRLLMRRDQVLKICANHYITADLKLSEMKAASNSLMWAAMDYADGDGKLEKFAARFKTPEQTSEFRQAFEKAQAVVVVGGGGKPAAAEPTAKPAAPSEQQGFGNKFAPKAGTWACPACYVNNTSDTTKCVACETLKPGTAPPAGPAASTPSSQFKFGVAVAQTTATTATTPAASTGFTFATTPASGGATGIKFGMPATTPSSAAAPPASTPSATTPLFGSGISFGATTTPSKGSLFGMPAATAPTSAATPSFSFSSLASSLATSTTTTPSASSAATTTAASKPAFSFTLPSSTTATAAGSTPVTKAPFSFSPPKLAVATPKTNGQTEAAPVATTAAPVSAFSTGSVFGTPKPPAAAAATPTTSVFPSTLFGTPRPSTEGQKPIFGGLTFGGTPSGLPSTTPSSEEKKGEGVKPSPFAGFSFSPKKETEEKKPAESGMLFSLLAKQAPSTGFAVTPNKEFPGTGAPLFSSSGKATTPSTSAKENEQEENDEENDGGEYEPNVAFEPVIPLPALVEVSTGEEEENVLFSDRAFLYRFVPDTKEWKEKGRGDMKILEHKTTGRTRLLMRREQVLKVCCNHAITPLLSLKPLQTSERTWTWTAQDFSENELVTETFALKFKTVDQAQRFKRVFEEAQTKSSSATSPAKPASGTQAAPSQPTAATKSLAEMFKPKEGSWECQGCFNRNAAEVIKCPSCETIKPGAEAPAATPTAEKAPGAAPSFKFGIGGGTGFNFGTPTSAPAPSPFGGFSFSMTPSATTTPSKPAQTKTGRSPNVSASSDNEYYEEDGEGDDIHFEPVIALPEKVQVKTGEEDEEVVYCHRAKLFRLADGEWKERGIGDVKILRHKTTGKTRLLMRREQILKICLNHALTPELIFRPKDEKSWLWAAKDFAEGDGRMETFVIRFRDADVSKAFMDAVQENQHGGGGARPSDEVELIFAKEATEEQKRKAAELQLPLNFFLYESAPPCPGCRGCYTPEDDAAVEAKAATPTTSKADAAPAASTKSDANALGSISFSKFAESSVSQLSFSSLTSASSSGFNKPSTFSWSGAGKPVFGQSTATTTTPTQAEEKANNADEGEDGGDDEAPESHDPHFEPIIPLPALVEVKTGEEDEELIFSHRAKLYRFESSTKEWKEKGVGDIKILHHRQKNTYRVLLRREQIYKLACNHWLTPDLSLKPMSTSATAWTWFAMDFSQGELLQEHFAVKFKTSDTAALFKTKFEECQAALRGSSTTTTQQPVQTDPVQASSAAAPSASAVPAEKAEEEEEGEEDNEGEEEEVEDEDQDEEDYEDVEESIMFEKRCTLSSLEGKSTDKTWVLLGTGNLKIVYDDEMLCARIVVEDGNDQLLCDNVIAIETNLKVDGKECIWSAIDYSLEQSAHRTFRAQFSSTDAALEFQAMFDEGKQFAEKSDVHDEPDLHAAGYDHSNDDHGDYVEGEKEPTPSPAGAVVSKGNLIRACDPHLAQALSDILNDMS